ncbi:MAG: hypothetical protein Q4C58_15975 [Eubacteriales bacterium]|nr:hypothetical protein [Eubacteriales bacterium]
MDKYVNDLQLFSKKLCILLKEKELTDKYGKPDPIKLHNALYPTDAISDEDIEKYGRSNFTEKTRKERNWINGENFPKRIGDILLLCNTFECDFDYFFTEMPCKTHGKQFIHEFTGLSENAIDYLHERSKSPQYLKVLNILLKPGNFDNAIPHIAKYMEVVKQFEGFNEIRKKRRDKMLLESMQEYGDLSHYNYPHGDSLETKIKDIEMQCDIEEFNIDKYFKYIIQEFEDLAKKECQ